MNIKKNFLSRIARRKSAAQAEPEEGYEIPPPAAIESSVPYATGNSEDKEPGSHQELELIASGEPAPTGSANRVDAVDGGDAPALEALAGPVTDESPDAPEPPREAAPYEEYGLDLELLSGTESEVSRRETESSHDDEVASPEAADNVAEASAPEAGVPQETEPGTMDEIAQVVVEPLAPVTGESPDEAVLSRDPNPDEGYGDDFEALAVAVSDESADAPGTEVVQENEPEAVDDAVAEDEETRTASVLQDSPDESPGPALAENGIFPLVRDARGVWRPGKGFSRDELREAGLSLADAAQLHIRFDKRRRNTHPVNVASLEQAKSGV